MEIDRVNRVKWLAPLAAAAMLTAGCSSKPKPQGPSTIHVPPERTLNADIVEMNFSQQIHNGAVIGQTIYPHHFVPHTSELNMIGERQVQALLPRSVDGPVEINVMRGDVSDTLYQARLETVRAAFINSGVAAERIAFADKLPSGDGMSSERAVRLAAQEEKRSEQSARVTSRSDRGGTSSRVNDSGMGGNTSSGSSGSSGGGSGPSY